MPRRSRPCEQLADYIAAGCKPREQFRIGTEHEKFGFRRADLRRRPTMPAAATRSIRALLEGIARNSAATPILDRGNPIGLKQGAASISLEPAGQFELSGAPLETLHDTKAELDSAFRPGARRGVAISASASPRSGSIRSRRDGRCPGCRKDATPSCGATCRRSGSSGWT